MASVHRRPRSKYWHAAWRDRDGKLKLCSTKQTNRSKALAFALDCERAEKLAGGDSLTEAQARKIVSDIMERAGTDEVLRNPSIETWLREWIKGKEARKSAGTAARYEHVVDEFIEHLGTRAKRPLNAVTSRDIEGFITRRIDAGCSTTTVNLDGKILRTAFNQARREGLISVNPVETLGHAAVTAIETCVNQHIAYLQFNDEDANPHFIRLFLESRYDELRGIGQAGGSTKGALTCGFLKTYLVPFAERAEQDEIADTLMTIERKIAVHERKRATLRELFKTLLHQLMTGQIRA